MEDHLRGAIESARQGYWSAFADEDTLTGQVLFAMKTGSHKVEVTQVEASGTWTWSIDYHKFRGDGPGAPETTLGADGIFIVTVDYGGQSSSKAALFQAKIEGRAEKDLISQCLRLSTWREAAFIVNYSPERFEAISLDEVLRVARSGQGRLTGKDLAGYLVEDFFPCQVGDTELSFDARRQVLRWRAMNDELVSTRFRIGKRVTFGIKAPRWRHQSREGAKLIPNGQVHEYRMQATPQEILALQPGSSNSMVSKRRRELAASYHTDGAIDLGELEFLLLKRRIQEINNAADEITGKNRRPRSRMNRK
jgi:hypothetical protein